MTHNSAPKKRVLGKTEIFSDEGKEFQGRSSVRPWARPCKIKEHDSIILQTKGFVVQLTSIKSLESFLRLPSESGKHG
jgi:hypothetical protein